MKMHRIVTGMAGVLLFSIAGCATPSGMDSRARPSPSPPGVDHFDGEFLDNLALEPPPDPKTIVRQDNCLEPEDGVWAPYGPDQYTLALKQLLFSRLPSNIILHVVSQPSFARSWMVALTEESQGARKLFRLNLVETDQDVWASMMKELETQHGTSFNLSDENQKNALEKVAARTTVHVVDIPSRMVESLHTAWKAALSTVTYVRAGRTDKLDGVVYTFWSDNMAGHAHSPVQGSFAEKAVRLSDTLRMYASAPPSERSPLERKLEDLARDIVSQKNAGVPCTASKK
jgi:hypothetical protein